MGKEHVIFDISCFSLQRQHHLTRRPRVSEAEELPLVLVALGRLQICLPPIQRAAGHRFLEDMNGSALQFTLWFPVSPQTS